jgi:hypothetical protein
MLNYYFDNLDDESKNIYNSIFDGLNEFMPQIILPLIAKKDLQTIYQAVLLDNPIIFYTKSYRYLRDRIRKITVLQPIYDYPESHVNESVELLSDFLQLFDVVKDDSDIEKELFVHDYCLENFTYDHEFNGSSFSILGLLVFEAGVCEGLAKFVKIVLNYLEVDCLVATGKAATSMNKFRGSERHAWNIVFVEGDPYHLDVTFDLSQTEKIKRYDYFNLSDDEIKIDHTITGAAPACAVAGNDYYSLSSQAFDSLAEMEEYLQAELVQGKNIVVFKLNSEEPISALNEKIIASALRQKQDLCHGNIAVEVKYNPHRYVFEVQFA